MLAPLSNDEIAAAKTHWEAKNDESLVDKLNSEIRGGLRELIVSLLTGKRAEGEEADEVRVLEFSDQPEHTYSTPDCTLDIHLPRS